MKKGKITPTVLYIAILVLITILECFVIVTEIPHSKLHFLGWLSAVRTYFVYTRFILYGILLSILTELYLRASKMMVNAVQIVTGVIIIVCFFMTYRTFNIFYIVSKGYELTAFTVLYLILRGCFSIGFKNHKNEK